MILLSIQQPSAIKAYHTNNNKGHIVEYDSIDQNIANIDFLQDTIEALEEQIADCTIRSNEYTLLLREVTRTREEYIACINLLDRMIP